MIERKKFYIPENIVISIFGDVNQNKTINLFNNVFNKYKENNNFKEIKLYESEKKYKMDFSKKITKENLKAVKGDNNPFNTYKIKGLPPRPICYPSLSSIESVIMSSPGEYFFFVAKGDGTHIFSKTLDEHNKAVNNR